MRLAAVCLAAVLAAAAPVAAQPPQGDTPPIVVEGDAIARSEIERILEADNLDTAALRTSEVLAAMRRIPRGRAPDDFWSAYQAHLRAWERFEAAEARAEALASGKQDGLEEAVAQVVQADRDINSTFDEVERIARRYGARLPTPRGEPSLPSV